MKYHDIQTLAVQRQQALQEELDAKKAAAEYKETCEHIKAQVIGAAYENDKIDKKNKDTRSAGEARVLSNSEEYQSALERKRKWEKRADQLGTNRRYWDTLVSLTKAWLYSQGGY